MAEYQDPTQSADFVRIDSWSAAVGRERHWYNPLSWGNSTYIIQKLSFNRYEDDEVPSQAKRREQKQPVGSDPRAQQGRQVLDRGGGRDLDVRHPSLHQEALGGVLAGQRDARGVLRDRQ